MWYYSAELNDKLIYNYIKLMYVHVYIYVN